MWLVAIEGDRSGLDTNERSEKGQHPSFIPFRYAPQCLYYVEAVHKSFRMIYPSAKDLAVGCCRRRTRQILR